MYKSTLNRKLHAYIARCSNKQLNMAYMHMLRAYALQKRGVLPYCYYITAKRYYITLSTAKR